MGVSRKLKYGNKVRNSLVANKIVSDNQQNENEKYICFTLICFNLFKILSYYFSSDVMSDSRKVVYHQMWELKTASYGRWKHSESRKEKQETCFRFELRKYILLFT